MFCRLTILWALPVSYYTGDRSNSEMSHSVTPKSKINEVYE